MNVAGENLCFLTISDLAKHIRNRDVSPVEVTEAMLERIDRHNDEMSAYITVTYEEARRQAREAEREIVANGYRGPLHGITISLKDNIATKGIRTSCGSMVAPNWIPRKDATVYTRLRDAGAILVGKANLKEYAFSTNPLYPYPTNTWRRDLASGGSSLGSAVSVSAAMAHGSIGSDTGGSGRSPANANGAVGIKATYGRVSRSGLFPLSYSLDHVTTMTRCVEDGAHMLQAISGHDSLDENSAEVPIPDFSVDLGRDLSGMRIAIARGFTYEDIDPDVVNTMASAYRTLGDLGAELMELELPHVQDCHDIFLATMAPEAATVHYKNLRNRAEGFGPQARARLALGNIIPATAYVDAQRARKLMRDGFRELFQSFDAIVGPCSPTRGVPKDELSTLVDGEKIDRRRLRDGYTNIYNLTGLPAMVVPAGLSGDTTPIGLQIAAKWWDEPTMLRIAYAFERTTNWHLRRPPLPIDKEANPS